MVASSLPVSTATPVVRIGALAWCSAAYLPLAILRVTPGGRQLDVCVELLGSPRHPWTAGGPESALGTLRAVVAAVTG